MPWIRVDDHYDEHPKFARAGPLGMAMWLAGLAYCNRNLTDGFIPWTIARTLMSWDYLDATGPTHIYVDSGNVTCEYVTGLLLDVGLWDEVDGGYRVHDYVDFQPTKAQVRAERATKIAAGRAG